MSDEESDWRAPPYIASRDAKPEPDIFVGPAQPDPRSPVRKVLDLFALDEEREEGLSKAILAAKAEAGESFEAALEQIEEAHDTYDAGGTPVVPGAPPPDVTSGASGAQVQISMPQLPFASWHWPSSLFPEEYDVPVRLRMLDEIARTMPESEEPSELGDNPDDPWDEPSWLGTLWLKLRALESKAQHAEHIRHELQDRLSKIKTSRTLMPVIEQGKFAGQLQSVGYQTAIGGQLVKDTGWMFVEDPKSEYAQWCEAQLQKRYDDAVAVWEKASVGAKKAAWADAAGVAGATAIIHQEGLPTSIATYDSRVLSWGIGLAAPGELQKVMSYIVKDPKIRKVFYCCGFKYECDIRAVRGHDNQYHGVYQVVDLEAEQIVYGDNFYHRTVPGEYKRGELQGRGFLALKAFVAQKELINMLIQVSRDPETRDTVFKHNYNFVRGAAIVRGYESIDSQALYVFAAQVQHNWGIASKDPINYAISTLTPAELALPRPSPDFDRALAKGIVRLVAKVLQEQRFQNAVKAARIGKYPAGLSKDSPIWKFPAATEWGPTRMLEHYWKRLQNGERSKDKSKLEVPGFMVPVKAAAVGSYAWHLEDGSGFFDLGKAKYMRLRFEHENILVREVADAKHVLVWDRNTGKSLVVDATLPP